MTDPNQDVRKSSSFDLVEKEIAHTIEQAELSLFRFQDNRESSEDLQNCVDCLNQLRGIFTLIELQGGTVLCQEIVALANEVPVGASDDKNHLLAILSQAIFVLRRYVEYFDRRREDHPELLLGIINQLRDSRRSKLLPDSYFFEVDLPKPVPARVGDEMDAAVFTLRVRRMRHMYQVGLVNVLRNRDADIGLRLISRSAQGFERICGGSSIAVLWHLTAVAVSLMHKYSFEISPQRKRLLMRIERHTRELVMLGKVATTKIPSDTLTRELLYLIAISGDQSEESEALLSTYGLSPQAFDEQKRIAHRHLLMGPGADVLRTLSKALHEELELIKDRLDILERGIDSPEQSIEGLAASLQRFSSTLKMLELQRLSRIAARLAERLQAAADSGRVIASDEWMEIAGSLLAIESAIDHLEDDGLTSQTDQLPDPEDQQQGGNFIERALTAAIKECHNILGQARRAITAYLEAGEDKLHLANLKTGLGEVAGAMIITDHPRAAQVIAAIQRFVEERILDTEEGVGDHLLETLADGLTSMEYFMESLERSHHGNTELIDLAEESMKALGYH